MRIFLSVAFIAFGFPAFAIAPCLPHDEMANVLADQFQEQQRFVGLDQGGNAGNIIAAQPQGVDG
jgi:hypothetical protein